MKTSRIVMLVILALLVTLFIGSCGSAGVNGAPATKPAESSAAPALAEVSPSASPSPSLSPSPAATLAPESAPPSPSAIPARGLTFEEKTYSKDAVKIKYPQLTGMSDGAAQEKLNKLISDTALMDVKELESGTEYELNYKVTFNTPSVISMYFDGYAYVPGAAHPYQFLRSVTIDTVKQTTVPLPSLVSISDSFADVMLKGALSSMGYDMTDEYETAIRNYLTESGAAFWTDLLRTADSASASVYSYLTEDALVLSVTAPHVMGDHVEITLPFSDLRGYQTDNLLWKEIEK